jgi:hypothetical protein
MKKVYLAALLVIGAITANAQKVYRVVDFNYLVSASNNDLTNNFSRDHRFFQIPNAGFTGGTVVVHDSAGAAPKYNNMLQVTTTPTTISMLFKYSRSLNTTSGLKSLLLDFTAVADTQRIRFYADAQSVGIMSYTKDVNATFASGDTLADKHWYQLKASLAKDTGDTARLITNVYLYDMGESPASVPRLMASKLEEVFANYFVYHNSVSTLSFYAEKRSGTEYLDNFTIYGSTVGISAQELEARIMVPTVITSAGLQVSSTLNTAVSYSLFDMQGRCLKSGMFSSKVTIDGSELAAGNYVIRFNARSEFITRRVVKY